MNFVKSMYFLIFFLNGNFGYKAPRDIPISHAWHINQSLVNFNQYFASDADYIIFARSLYEQHNLRSSVNFAIHNIKPGTLTAGTVKINFKGTVAMFVARYNAFLLTVFL